MKILQWPKQVGWLIVFNNGIPACEIKVSIHRKPRLLHLLMMRWFFGWKYESVQGLRENNEAPAK